MIELCGYCILVNIHSYVLHFEPVVGCSYEKVSGKSHYMDLLEKPCSHWGNERADLLVGQAVIGDTVIRNRADMIWIVIDTL